MNLRITVVTWYDDLNQPFSVDYYQDHIRWSDITHGFIESKAARNRHVIATYPDTLVFNDGTRVVASVCSVKAHLETYTTEDTIDVSVLNQSPTGNI